MTVLWWRWCEKMVMATNDDDIWWQNMLAPIFWEEPFGSSFGNWLCLSSWCLSCWCLGGLAIVSRWSLVIGGTLAVCPSCLDGVRWWFGSLAYVFVVFLWCLGGVPMVCWWYWRNGISNLVHLSIPNWRQRQRKTLLLGLCAGLICCKGFLSCFG